MAFDFNEWKRHAGEAFRRFNRGAAQYGPGALYTGLCATALWPVARAMGSDGMLAGAYAFGGLLANVGANLIAAKVWDLKGKTEEAARCEVETWVAEQAQTNRDVRAAVDEILTKLDAAQQAQSSLTETDKMWFVETLLKDVETLGSTLRVTINTGGGAYISGGVRANGDVVMGDKIIGTLIESLTIVSGKTEPSEERGWLASYLRTVTEDCSGLNLQAIDDSAARVDREGARREPPKLSDVYVDLKTQLRIPSDFATLRDYFDRAKDTTRPHKVIQYESEKLMMLSDIESMRRELKMRQVSVLEAFAHHPDLVLLGKPGSGKSTFASFVSLNLARAASSPESGLKALGDRWTHGVLIPVRVILRKFAGFLSKSESDGDAGDLWRFIRTEIENELGPHEADLIERMIKCAGALFIFDGLDEASTPDLRRRVQAAIQDFKPKAHEKSRFLTTARPYAWGTPDPSRGEYEVADFDADQIKTFVERWYDALVDWGWLRQDEADDKRDHLLPACARSDLQPLAKNPLLLTLMTTLNTNRMRLPDDRADLYDEVVDLLLERWNQRLGKDLSLLEQLKVPQLTIANLRDVVEKVAFEAHKAHEGKDGTADIDSWTLINAFESLLGSLDKAQIVLNYVDERAGLLIGLGDRRHDGEDKPKFAFPHRTFQEFLAGCYLPQLTDFNRQVCELAQSNAGHWRLALTFAARRARTERGVSAADALIYSDELALEPNSPVISEGNARRATIAADQLLELGIPAVTSSEQGRKVKRRVATWIVAAMGSMEQRNDRADARRILAEFGDPRLGVLGVDDMLFCCVPQIEFQMGENRYSDERPMHEQEVLQEFWISKHAITNAQFAQFVRDEGYTTQDFWTEALMAKRWNDAGFRDWKGDWRRGPRLYGMPFGQPNHPVVGVSWYEALAFARWLERRLPFASARLPSEAEWECAARGPRFVTNAITPLIRNARALSEITASEITRFRESIASGTSSIENQRAYPWGDIVQANTMNFAQEKLDGTSPVGAFPSGASPFGCDDMSGNVWEWTTTKDTNNYLRYAEVVENGPDASEAKRIVRGGAFSSPDYEAHCAFRNRNVPYYVSRNVGFRVVVSSIHG